MLSRGLIYFTESHLTLIGFLIFIFSFMAIGLWTFTRRGSKEFYAQVAALPLTEPEEKHHE